MASVLHFALFHPLDDHYGLAPLEAAQQSLDLHNAAAHWNKALLDNSARPSGALVYSAGTGHLTHDQFERLKAEEKAKAQDLQRSGKWRHLWRVAGHYSNISVFDVDSHDELHAILSGLPLFPFMEMTVTPLARHPSAITDD